MSSFFNERECYLFSEGTYFRSYEKLGAHKRSLLGKDGFNFAVWAPEAKAVSVVGDFNNWSAEQMYPVSNTGIWEVFIAGANNQQNYKYKITTKNGEEIFKIDPYAFLSETPPRSASVVYDREEYKWNDSKWMSSRGEKHTRNKPISIYEIHLASWKRKEDGSYFSYLELAETLPEYIKKLGFTHVEFMPITEYPFDPSWGYQTFSFFAPTSRFGSPDDLRVLIDKLHQNNIGVILDWVPAHFPTDAHGLYRYDGSALYEHLDPRKGFHPDWNTAIFNYGRREVLGFLISSALFWLDKFHIDGLRVDAVSSMLYLDYSRKEGEWVPNQYGGRENLEAIEFLKTLNREVYKNYPDTFTVAEESTAWPKVSHPIELGGLGFGYKWNMGWMHDSLRYFDLDPIYRKHHQQQLTFGLLYAYHENFMLPLSHDEVVHGKGSLLQKMPGDNWQKFANLRLLYSYQYAMPGKKLLFMGAELAEWREWNFNSQLCWEALNDSQHKGIFEIVSDLNNLFKSNQAFYEFDSETNGFSWIDFKDTENSVISFLRIGSDSKVLCVFNFTPVQRDNYQIPAPDNGVWKEIFNSNSSYYGGTGVGNLGEVLAKDKITLTLPPLSALFFKQE